MRDDIIGFIPAAGKGSRLGYATPKELLPFPGEGSIKPIIAKTIENMKFAGIEHVIVATSIDKPEIMKYLQDGYDFSINISYVCQVHRNIKQYKTSGFVEVIDSAYHLLKGNTILFGMPDTYVDPYDIYSQALQEFIDDKLDIAFICFKTNTPSKFGMVHFNKQKEVIQIFDKPTNIENLQYMWGALIWSPRITDSFHYTLKNRVGVNSKFKYDDILNQEIVLGAKTRVFTFDNGKYIDIGTQEDAFKFYRGK